MNTIEKKNQKRLRLKGKIRSRISGTETRPRLSVYRSNKFIYGQIIDDTKGVTVVSISDMVEKAKKGGRVASASAMGALIATRAKEKNITAVVFDRNGFKYTGRVKAFADGAREGGLTF
jgi:large subunit ribosomal protein L18